MGRLALILGGARGGKSDQALQLAQQSGGRVLFVATAQAFDDEMRDRITRHRLERPGEWATVEAPIHVAAALNPLAAKFDVVIVDCLTLLASNVLLALPEDAPEEIVLARVQGEVSALLALCRSTAGQWLIVSNEVGMGVVPATPMGRLFRDVLGRANQQVALAADEVILMVAGLPWRLKG